MRALRLVGPDPEGTSLIVEAVDEGSLEGERFTLPLDDRLRGLARTDTDRQAATWRPSEPSADNGSSTPTPREIQVRVRAGETAEAVAEDAGIPLERVMRFAYPVLQERLRVTDEARRARARRGGDGLLVPFGELIDSRLARHGIDPTAVNWDAFRREDGGWTVTARFSSYQRDMLAKFSFALANRTVSALDDIAADLLSDRPVQALLEPAPPVAEPPAQSAQSSEGDWEAGGPPRLTAVPDPNRSGPRAQEASPAIRPPSRRQKAHTRPVPITVDDELFDQDAFDQQPWHEPPLPFEVGAGRPATPRHRAQRPGDVRDAPEPVRLGGTAAVEQEPAAPVEGSAPAEAGAFEAGAFEAGPSEAGSFEAGPLETGPLESETAFAAPIAAPATDHVPSAVQPVPVEAAAGYGAGQDTGQGADQDSETVLGDVRVVVPAGGDAQAKRGRRAGEKPRMPSWDDILLGVRHKSD
ncbi:MAG: hypothetical protein QOE23_843 [Pseudonocardiales bacterium]|nr:hypothetical protein [Pseudonocardiales bacterium]